MDVRLLSILIAVASLLGPVDAWALDLRDCDDMTLAAEDVKDVKDVKDVVVDRGAEVDTDAGFIASEFVVPCAMAENGTLGPACQDAPFYVVNQNGTLLCRVDFAAFGNAAPVRAVDPAPAAPAQGAGVAFAAAVVPVVPRLLPTAGFLEVLRNLESDGLAAADAHTSFQPRPS